MQKSLRSITKSGFMQRLGLFDLDMKPAAGSKVRTMRVEYFNEGGETLGTYTRRLEPISGKWLDSFGLWVEMAETDEAHSSLWN